MDSWMTIFVPANRCEQSRRRELQKQPKSRGGVKPRRSSCRIYALNRPAGSEGFRRIPTPQHGCRNQQLEDADVSERGPWVDSGFLDLLQEPEQGSSAPRAKMEFSVICASSFYAVPTSWSFSPNLIDRLHFFRLTLSHCVGWKEGFHVSAHLLWDYEEAA
uniref:uncharacterized protein LOC118551966 isoform X8 n=1 Tax=Halichoerus grypus TaxID=9711 RepID=UPI001659EF9D|nr:uncharacterized protein LOC118551966 isoform X8 [Halichoerus grypus]